MRRLLFSTVLLATSFGASACGTHAEGEESGASAGGSNPQGSSVDASVAPSEGGPTLTGDAGETATGSGGGGDGGHDAGGGGSVTGVQAQSATAFLESMGINIHDDQDGTDDYAAEFIYTGIRNARAAELRSTPQIALHEASVSGDYPGVKFSIIPYGGSNIANALADAVNLKQAGILVAIEGPNEPNNQPFTYNGVKGGGGTASWLPVAQFQRDLYAAVKSNPVLADVPVYSLTEGGAEVDNVGLQFLTIPDDIPGDGGASLPAGTKFSDFGNLHNYVAPGDNNAWNNASPNTAGPGDGMYGEFVGETWRFHYAASPASATIPHVTTETGWSTSSKDVSSFASPEAQALDILDIYLAQFTRGFAKTFIYELLDDDGGNSGFGVFDSSRNPKTSATYIHNLTTILADTAEGALGKIDYSIPDEPSTAHDLLLEKSDGTFYLVVWNERLTGADALTVDLGASYDVTVYDATSGTLPVKTLGTVTSVALTADNRPYILALE